MGSDRVVRGHRSEITIRWILGGIGAGCFALLLVLEVVTEQDEITFADFFVDALNILLTIGAAVGVALLAQRIRAQYDEKMTLIRDLETARADGEAWRSKVQTNLAGIRQEMDSQFEAWSMTAAEQDIALLMLKGLSHKEIATLRNTAEATVRQQAQSIYQKSGLPGRSAFAAYFLEDLFAPMAAADGGGTAASGR